MNDLAIQSFCKKNGIMLPVTWRHSCNAVRFHNKGESYNHWFYKTAIAHALMSKGQTIFTEMKLPSRHAQPVCDLFWLDEKIVIEFESEFSEKKKEEKLNQYHLFNAFIIDIKRESVEDVKRKVGLV